MYVAFTTDETQYWDLQVRVGISSPIMFYLFLPLNAYWKSIQ